MFKFLANAGDVSDTQRKIQRKCASTNPQKTTDAKKSTSYLKKQNHKHPNVCMFSQRALFLTQVAYALNMLFNLEQFRLKRP
jgi:hypothetical protein